MATLPSNLKLSRDQVDALKASLQELVDREVLVGFPEETSARNPEDGEPQGITNAALGYIHDNGAPEQNIPQRQFMRPAIESVRDKLTVKLAQMARRVVVSAGSAGSAVTQGFNQVGIIAELAIKKKINEGIPPPLADQTLRQRASRGRKGAEAELLARGKGEAPGTQLAKPLVDSAQMRNAVKYVVRSRRKREE